MKRFAIASLSILCLSLIATTSVKAETRTGYLSMVATTTSSNTESVNTAPIVAATSLQSETRTGHLSMAATTTNSNTESSKITPFELVSRAYQGDYKMQGIGGFGSFSSSSGKVITAKELVSAAIEARQLPALTQTVGVASRNENRDYLNAVDIQLLGLQD
jgi:uncharacterized protein YdbL (DUF1318 family)